MFTVGLLIASISGLSEAEIRRQLVEEEERAVKSGARTMVHNISAISMLIIGLDLEEQQWVLVFLTAHGVLLNSSCRALLQREVRGTAQQTRMYEQRTSFHRRLKNFRQIQTLYMPIVCQKVAKDPSSTEAPQLIEKTPLYLPSSLSPADRLIGCTIGLAGAELNLRQAQCRDALEQLRTMIHIRARLIQYKRYDVRHVGPNTRCNELIVNHEARITRVADKYRRARKAVFALAGTGPWESELRELRVEDLRGLQDDDPETVKRKEEQMWKRRKKNKLSTPAEGNRVQSWIWSGVSNGDKPYDDSEYWVCLYFHVLHLILCVF